MSVSTFPGWKYYGSMSVQIGSKHPRRLYIRERLEKAGIDQQTLAGRMGCSPSQVSKLLKNPIAIDGRWLGRFADALDVSPTDLYYDPEAPTQDELLAAGTAEELKQAIQLVRLAKAS